MGASYREFCPVSKAVELLDERCTLLVVRELRWGSTRFNEIRRGVPRMSPARLSARLVHLTKAGVVERRAAGREVSYVLTDIWLANVTWTGAVRAGTLEVSGPTALRRLMSRMFFNAHAAAVTRPAMATR